MFNSNQRYIVCNHWVLAMALKTLLSYSLWLLKRGSKFIMATKKAPPSKYANVFT